jgi:hypothetical protein
MGLLRGGGLLVLSTLELSLSFKQILVGQS